MISLLFCVFFVVLPSIHGYGRIGCNYQSDLCGPNELCLDDHHFGVCADQNGASGLVAYRTTDEDEALLAELGQWLLQQGFSLESSITQCILAQVISALPERGPGEKVRIELNLCFDDYPAELADYDFLPVRNTPEFYKYFDSSPLTVLGNSVEQPTIEEPNPYLADMETIESNPYMLESNPYLADFNARPINEGPDMDKIEITPVDLSTIYYVDDVYTDGEQPQVFSNYDSDEYNDDDYYNDEFVPVIVPVLVDTIDDEDNEEVEPLYPLLLDDSQLVPAEQLPSEVPYNFNELEPLLGPQAVEYLNKPTVENERPFDNAVAKRSAPALNYDRLDNIYDEPDFNDIRIVEVPSQYGDEVKPELYGDDDVNDDYYYEEEQQQPTEASGPLLYDNVLVGPFETDASTDGTFQLSKQENTDELMPVYVLTPDYETNYDEPAGKDDATYDENDYYYDDTLLPKQYDAGESVPLILFNYDDDYDNGPVRDDEPLSASDSGHYDGEAYADGVVPSSQLRRVASLADSFDEYDDDLADRYAQAIRGLMSSLTLQRDDGPIDYGYDLHEAPADDYSAEPASPERPLDTSDEQREEEEEKEGDEEGEEKELVAEKKSDEKKSKEVLNKQVLQREKGGSEQGKLSRRNDEIAAERLETGAGGPPDQLKVLTNAGAVNDNDGQTLAKFLRDQLGLTDDSIQFVNITTDNWILLNVRSAAPLYHNASMVARDILYWEDAIESKLGLEVVAVRQGTEQLSLRLDDDKKYSATVLGVAVFMVAVLALIAFVVYMRRQTIGKQKLRDLLAFPYPSGGKKSKPAETKDPELGETDEKPAATKHYQELCRQHAAETATGGDTAVKSVVAGDEPSSPSGSESSSWTASGLHYSLDISTGHTVLAYMEEHLENKDKLREEWLALCDYVADPCDTSTAERPENTAKNRYGDILPYEHRRVKLNAADNVNGSDYVNASMLSDHDPRQPAYVATQDPQPHTVADFWQMVWEQQSTVIVMLTPLDEQFLQNRYWPADGPALYHLLEVTLISEHVQAQVSDFVVRNFHVRCSRTGQTRTVTQFHFKTWNALELPKSPAALLEFRRKVNKNFKGNGPIVVHCNDGAGRTGTYILVDMVLNRIQRGAKEVDMAATLEHLRDQRMQMIKTEEQFEFALQCVAEEVNAMIGHPA